MAYSNIAPIVFVTTESQVLPVWQTVDQKFTVESDLPDDYDVSGFVSSTNGALHTWELTVAPNFGFTIDQAGVIRATEGRKIGNHSLQVSVWNDEGAALSNTFSWTITGALEPPVWITIDDQVNSQNELPKYLNCRDYVTSNSGTLRNFELVGSPAGFEIDPTSGVITATDQATATVHPLIVRVENDTGTSDQNFNWEITSGPISPVYDPRTDYENSTVNWDAKVGWTNLIGNESWSAADLPTGLAIDPISGIVSGMPTTISAYSTTITANDGMDITSLPFTWTIQSAPPAPTVGSGAMNLNLNLKI